MANWQRMPADMREFVTALVEVGAFEGRRALAYCRVAVHPETLPPSGGVQPYIQTRAEREDIERTRAKGRR
jgi:hypothetical protein